MSKTRRQSRRRRLSSARGIALVVFAVGPLLASSADHSSSTPALRRPVALVLAEQAKWLFVANRDSGTICVIDTAAAKVTVERPVGRKLADLVVTADGKQLLAVDPEANELIVLKRQGPDLETAHRLKVSPAPISVCLGVGDSRCTVAALWSRRVDIVSLDAPPHVVQSVDLPFAPRAQLIVPNQKKLVIAEAFGSRLAVIDIERGEVDSVRSLPAHNIRGLALSGDGKRLLVAHEILHPRGQATRDDIHWGNMLTNNLRSLALTDVLDPRADLLHGSELNYFGEAGHGSADPAGVTVAPGGKVLVPLAGVGELAIGDPTGWRYLPVGSGPTAVALSPDGRRAYVANMFSDSVSVVDTSKAKVTEEIAFGTGRALTAAERGEALFHDARLSHDGWMSCHSCHTDGHSNGKLADTLGDGTYGTPKRVLSLLGVGDTGPWAWNGSMSTLEGQVRKSIETTMHGKKPTDEQVHDLTAYLKTLHPPPSRDRLIGHVDAARIEHGREVFTRHSCGNCHAPPVYTSSKTYDVGLADELNMRHFNPPSLRGISQAGPYFHDGRAATLDDVFTKHRHQLKSELAKDELGDLLIFLNSL